MLINFTNALWERLSNREGLEMREKLECIKGHSSRNRMTSLVLYANPRVSVVSSLIICLSVEEKVLASIVNRRMSLSVKKTNSVLSEKAFLTNTKC